MSGRAHAIQKAVRMLIINISNKLDKLNIFDNTLIKSVMDNDNGINFKPLLFSIPASTFEQHRPA